MTSGSRAGVACLAALLTAAGCGKNTASLAELDAPAAGAPSGTPAGMPSPPPGGAWTGEPPHVPAAAPWSLSGVVTVAPALVPSVPPDAVLFVFARLPGQRMPVAVQRFPAPRFPVEFVLEAGHAGEPGAAPPARLEVVARVSRGGMAGPPQSGDLEGLAAGPFAPGAVGITVTVDTAR